MLIWTRKELLIFVLTAIAVTTLFDIFDLAWLRLPWTPIALIGTAVAFYIGFQSNSAYGRIWEARKIWGGITNNSRIWGMLIKDMITNEYASEEQKLSQEEINQHKSVLVHRHIAWLTALRFAMRAQKPWEVFLNEKSNREWADKMCIPEFKQDFEEELKKLISPEEFAYVMTKTNKPATLLNLQSKHIRELKEQGVIWEFSFIELEGILKELYNLQGKSERIKNFPYPRQFATLTYDFVRIFILVLPFGVVPEFAKVGQSLHETAPLLAPYFIWLAVPFTTIVSWVFHTMQRISSVGENPFEGSANDVPISSMARGMEIDLREMLDEENIPEPYPIKHNIQM